MLCSVCSAETDYSPCHQCATVAACPACNPPRRSKRRKKPRAHTSKSISVSGATFDKLQAYVNSLPKHERHGAKARLIEQWLTAATEQA